MGKLIKSCDSNSSERPRYECVTNLLFTQGLAKMLIFLERKNLASGGERNAYRYTIVILDTASDSLVLYACSW